MNQQISYIYRDEKGNPLYRQNRYYKDGQKCFYGERFVEGQWIKGLEDVRRVLYKLPEIIDGIKKAEKIYFVEGEKDVETLIKKGKLATTIAGGANQKWQDSFTDTLKSADVIIIPDNDKAGQEFAMRVVDSLAGNANTVKLLDLKKKWPDLKEKGDITDVFEMVGNDEDVLSKLEELEKETTFYIKKPKKEVSKQQNEFEIEELGLKWKVPKSYAISLKDGIKVTKKINRNIVDVQVSPVPILISKILKNIDTDEEKVELIFYKRKKWQNLIVDKNTLYSSQNILSLANKGLPVSSKTNLDLVSWLYELEGCNLNDLEIERNINRLGWVDKKTFIPYRNNDIHLELEPGIKSWLDKINDKKGTIEEWKENIKMFLKDDETGIIRFIISAGFSSCLLKLVSLRGAVINIYGPSGIGKTALLELANSIYAPADNIITFAATATSITILSERLSGIGLIIEEKQSAFDDSKISTLVYSLSEGRTRLKATKESDLITNKKFELITITSAEEGLNDKVGTHTGASRRTLELYTNKIFSSDEMSIKAHRVCRQAYGLAGEIFINKLIDNYSDNDYKDIVDKYEKVENILRDKVSKNVVSSYIQTVAVIVVANILMNEFFDFKYDEESSIEMGLNILNQLENEKEIDEIEKAKEILEDWILVNDEKFDRQEINREYINENNDNEITELLTNSKSTEKFGMYLNGVYYIFPLKFNEVMRNNNLSPNKIRRGFAERGYILVDEVNNRFTITKFYRGGNRRMLAFKLENERKQLESQIEGSIEESIVSKGIVRSSYEECIDEGSIEDFENSLKAEGKI